MNLRLLKIASLCLSAASVSFAQTSPAKAAADETIKLEEFSVKSDRSNGYRATNSITGTGIGTLIADSPLPINVLTGEFIKDLAQTRLAEALAGKRPMREVEPEVERALTISALLRFLDQHPEHPRLEQRNLPQVRPPGCVTARSRRRPGSPRR